MSRTFRRRVGVVALAAVVLGGGWWLWARTRLPDIPQPQIAPGADPVIGTDVASAREAVVKRPRSSTAWGEYGLTLRAYQFHPEADVCFRTAAALDPADGRWPYLLGHHYAPTDPSAAAEWFGKAAAARGPAGAPETARLRMLEALLTADRVDEARAALGSETPASPRGQLVSARVAVRADDTRRALELLAGLTDHPVAARQALSLQSQIYLRQGRTALAAHVGKRAASAPELDWPDPIADEVRRRDHTRAGRLDEAARLLRAGQALDAERLLRPLTANAPDARPFVGLAEARFGVGDRVGAVQILEEGRRLFPQDVAVNYQLGFRRFEDGERLWAEGQLAAARDAFQAAVGLFDAVLAVDPTFGKALLLKGVACHRFLGRTDEGMGLLRQFVRLRPEVGEGHLLLGQALAAAGQVQEARECLQRASELAPPGDHRATEAMAALGATPGRR
jgi:tetratricopeptide (TPR) repeat protein